MSRADLDWFELRFPRTLDEASTLAALSSFAGLPHGSRLIFDLSATSEGIRHHLGISRVSASTITAALRGAVPSLRLDTAKSPPEPKRGLIWQLTPSVAAIRSDRLPAANASLLSSLFPLSRGESIRLRWHLRPSPRPRLDFASKVHALAARWRSDTSWPCRDWVRTASCMSRPVRRGGGTCLSSVSVPACAPSVRRTAAWWPTPTGWVVSPALLV